MKIALRNGKLLTKADKVHLIDEDDECCCEDGCIYCFVRNPTVKTFKQGTPGHVSFPVFDYDNYAPDLPLEDKIWYNYKLMKSLCSKVLITEPTELLDGVYQNTGTITLDYALHSTESFNTADEGSGVPFDSVYESGDQDLDYYPYWFANIFPDEDGSCIGGGYEITTVPTENLPTWEQINSQFEPLITSGLFRVVLFVHYTKLNLYLKNDPPPYTFISSQADTDSRGHFFRSLHICVEPE